jgi:TPP-dependent pyruvate/acetoin dehydrogenase alpha subunit
MKQRDPLPIFRAYLMEKEILSEAQDKEFEGRAKEEVEDAVRFATEAPYPEVETAAYPVYAEDIRRG